MQLERVRQRFAQRDLGLELTDAARDWLAERGYDPIYGARPLKRVLRRELEDKVALALLDGRIAEGDTVKVDATRGRSDDHVMRSGFTACRPGYAVAFAGTKAQTKGSTHVTSRFRDAHPRSGRAHHEHWHVTHNWSESAQHLRAPGVAALARARPRRARAPHYPHHDFEAEHRGEAHDHYHADPVGEDQGVDATCAPAQTRRDKTAPAKKSTAKKSTAKKSTAKKATAKKATAKKS